MLYLSFSYLAGQENTQLPFVIPLHLFSCENEASLREPPTWDSSRRLLENFEVDGFVSAGEPILVRFQDGPKKHYPYWDCW
jgi:hypothetical protein